MCLRFVSWLRSTSRRCARWRRGASSAPHPQLHQPLMSRASARTTRHHRECARCSGCASGCLQSSQFAPSGRRFGQVLCRWLRRIRAAQPAVHRRAVQGCVRVSGFGLVGTCHLTGLAMADISHQATSYFNAEEQQFASTGRRALPSEPSPRKFTTEVWTITLVHDNVPVPGYTGHVPRRRYDFSHTYGSSAQHCIQCVVRMRVSWRECAEFPRRRDFRGTLKQHSGKMALGATL